MLAFLGAGEARGKRDAAWAGGAVCGVQGGGAMVCRRWPSGRLLVVCRGWLGGGDPAAICGGNSAVFNQQLTIFLVVAIIWRLTVFFLCSYCLFWRRLGRFRLPGAGRGLADGLGGLRGGLGLLAVGCWIRKGGVAEKGTVLLRMGVEYCPTSSPPLHGLWGWRKTGRVSFCNPGLKSSEPHAGLSKISSFYWTCFERKLCYFEDRETI